MRPRIFDANYIIVCDHSRFVSAVNETVHFLPILVNRQCQSYNSVMNAENRNVANETNAIRTKRPWSRWIFIIGGIYGLFVVLLAVNENRLVYPGSTYPRGNWNPDFPFEEVAFESKDGTELVGWYLPFDDATETVLVCHGNAENVSQSSQGTGLKFQGALNANVFVFDYRGYGKSRGSPFEQGVLEDSEAAFKWLIEKSGKKANEIILVGHSIGGGPAVHLADKFGAKAMFLQRTFSSLVEPAQNRYWFVPVSLIMQNRFESAEKIKDCTVPLHQSHGDQDQLVPIQSGRKVYDNSPAEIKEFFVNKGDNHWDPLPTRYWASVIEFLEKVNE